jgi:hypothetical protein
MPAVRTAGAALVPVDLEAFGDEAARDARLPLMVGVDRAHRVDLVPLAALEHSASAYIAGIDAVLRRQEEAVLDEAPLKRPYWSVFAPWDAAPAPRAGHTSLLP